MIGAVQDLQFTGKTGDVGQVRRPIIATPNPFDVLQVEPVGKNEPLVPSLETQVRPVPEATRQRQFVRLPRPQAKPQAIHSRTVQATFSSVTSPDCPTLFELQLWHSSGQQVTALIDSGATHSFIQQDVAERLGATMIEGDPMVVTLADSSQHKSSTVAEIQLMLAPADGSDKGAAQRMTFRVLPQLSSSIILGMDWLKATNPTIDWVDYTVSVKLTDNTVVQCNTTPLAGSVKVQLCSIQVALKQVECYNATAWFALLRESRAPQCNSVLGAQIGDPVTYGKLCDEYSDVFAEPTNPPDRLYNHRIDLIDEQAKPPKPRQYRLSQAEQDEVTKQVESLLQKGWIRPSVSPYGAPILFVWKKTGELRMCIDYRMLNNNTIVDVFPIPRIADLLDKLCSARVFSSIDLASAYHQVKIHEPHIHRTAFLTPSGLYEYVVLPFGLCNAPATFQRLMQHTFKEGFGKFMVVYLDDILVFSPTVEQHYQDLRWVLEWLRRDKFFAKRQKCTFGADTVKYLGHVISQGTITVDQSKTDAIRLWPTPASIKEVQQFLGLANYYNQYIRDFATIAQPLNALLVKNTMWTWGNEQQTAFDELKSQLCSAPVLRLPDMSRDFIVDTDASDIATGAVLLQQYPDGLHPVAYSSKRLNPAERNYSVYDKELLAIYRACMQWRCYLDGRSTTVYTDHQPFTYISQSSHPSRRAANWIDRLQELSLTILHCPGPLNVVADKLSRIPDRAESKLSDGDLACVGVWLKRVAPHCGARECADAAFKALSNGRVLEFILCKHCSAAHLDQGPWATRLHVAHQCQSCGKNWDHRPEVQGNPLAVWHPRVHGHQLLLDADPTTAHVKTIVVEPTWLALVGEAQRERGDSYMADLWKRARGQDAQYVVHTVHGVELVYRRGPRDVLQLVIPQGRGLRSLLMQELHSSLLAGHLGVRKTIAALKQRVFWPGMDRDVVRFVRGCSTCARTKDSTTIPQGLLAPLPIPNRKFEQWSIDFVTDLPTVNGYNGFMTCVDKFSKLTRIIPVRIGSAELSATEVARLFFEFVVRHYGIPKSVLHDRDPRFTSNFWSSLWAIMGSKTVFSSAFHPQTDGQTERQHRTIEQIIRAHVLENPDVTLQGCEPFSAMRATLQLPSSARALQQAAHRS